MPKMIPIMTPPFSNLTDDRSVITIFRQNTFYAAADILSAATCRQRRFGYANWMIAHGRSRLRDLLDETNIRHV